MSSVPIRPIGWSSRESHATRRVHRRLDPAGETALDAHPHFASFDRERTFERSEATLRQ